MSSILRKHLKDFATRKLTSVLWNCKRTTTSDQTVDRIGNREIVGYGWNGSPNYLDRPDFPFPSVRFREATPELCMLREKEKSDWKKLSIDEKKALYRYTFCQTFAEMKAPTGEWKFCIGLAAWIISCVFLLATSYYFVGLYGEYPETFKETRRRAQLKRMIDLEVNPVTGLTSKWDYSNQRWK